MYTCYTKVVQEEIFFQHKMLPLFYIHLLLVYSLIGVILLKLLYKTIHCPKMYRKKYIIIMGAIVVIIGLDICHVVFDTVLNYMIFGFTIGAIGFYYYAIVYTPTALLNHVLRSTIADMKEGLVICDNDRQCVYANTKAIEILQLQEEGKHFFEAFIPWCKERGLQFGFFLVVQDRTVEALALVKEHYKANYDSLTGVYNRP